MLYILVYPYQKSHIKTHNLSSPNAHHFRRSGHCNLVPLLIFKRKSFPSSLRQHLFYQRPETFRLGCWRLEFYHFTLGVQYKLREVPWNLSAFLTFLVVKETPRSQILVKRMRIRPVDLNLGKYRKPYSVTLYPLFYLCFFIRLLFKELITGKGQYFKPFLMVVGIQLSQLLIIYRRETSLSRHIDDYKHLDFPRILLEMNYFAINVPDLKVEEVVDFI